MTMCKLMPVGTLTPQGANRCRNKGIGYSNKTYASVFCKWLNRSGYRGSGFKFTVLGCKIRAVVKSVASMGAVHGKNDFNISVFDTKTAKMI